MTCCESQYDRLWPLRSEHYVAINNLMAFLGCGNVRSTDNLTDEISWGTCRRRIRSIASKASMMNGNAPVTGTGTKNPLPIITINATSALELMSPLGDRYDLWFEGRGHHSWKHSIPRKWTLDQERRATWAETIVEEEHVRGVESLALWQLEMEVYGDEQAVRITTGNHTRKTLAAISAEFLTQRSPPKSPPPSSYQYSTCSSIV